MAERIRGKATREKEFRASISKVARRAFNAECHYTRVTGDCELCHPNSNDFRGRHEKLKVARKAIRIRYLQYGTRWRNVQTPSAKLV